MAAHGTPVEPPIAPEEETPHKIVSGENAHLKLGRYEVVRELGKGAMGIVYLAKDPLIGRLVALKTIRASAHADDDETREFQQRFVREAQAAGILNHPNIVTVHDIGQDEPTNTSFIAMEYVEGQNLKEVLAQGRALSFEQIADLVAQVAEGLDFAHAKGIVHRDVKPANIILVEGNRAKITDFGIAKIASSGANLTSTGQFLGTPNYMAPEQVKGAPVDGRTDIFSLGICLYECLTRRKPFGGDSLTSISYKIVHEPFPPLFEVNPQIPDGFEEVITHCLAKEPAKRYQRARDLSAALRAVIRGEKPVKTDAALAEETMVTRIGGERDKLPTIEMSLEEAANLPEVVGSGSSTRPVSGAAVAVPPSPAAAAVAAATPTKPSGKVKVASPPLPQQLRRTLTNVRALPLWRTRIAPPIFFAIVALFVAGLIGAVALVRSRNAVVPVVDAKAEAQSKREKQLRGEGQALLRQGRVHDAYVKFTELDRVTQGSSPYVKSILQRLNAIRQQEEISRQQLAVAQQKFNEGLALYNAKKFADAIPLFQESFSINPSSEEAAQYLKLAQQEEQKIVTARQTKRQQQATTPGTRVATGGTRTTTPAGGTAGDGATIANAAPAQLTTFFNSPFTDGYILVKHGGDTVAHEYLWEEKGRSIFRRKNPKVVNVTKELPAKNADLEIWVVVPAQKISEHHVISAKLAPGGTSKLTVSYDKTSKKFDYQLN